MQSCPAIALILSNNTLRDSDVSSGESDVSRNILNFLKLTMTILNRCKHS